MSIVTDSTELGLAQAAKGLRDLLAEQSTQRPFRFQRLTLLWPFLRQHLALAGATVILAVTASALVAPVPLIQRRIIDRHLPSGEVRSILLWCSILVLLYALTLATKLALSYASSRLNSALMLSIKRAIVERVISFPLSFFSQHQSGYLASRVTEFDRAGGMFSVTFFSLIVSVVTFLISAALLVALEWRVFAVAAVFAPAQYAVARRLSGGIRGISAAILEKTADANRSVQEIFAGISTVKAFAREGHETRRMDAPFQSLFRTSFLQSFFVRSSADVLGFVNEMAYVAILTASVLLMVEGSLTIGTFVAALVLVERMFAPIQAVATAGLMLQPMVAAVNRVADYFEILGEDRAPERTYRPERLLGSIEFRHVGFAYPGEPPTLVDVSFTIHPGDRIALIGSNGSGKTTLAKLLMQFHLPQQGAIVIDDHDARTFALDCLRRQIGLASQDVFLFNDTILSNLTYGGVPPTSPKLHDLVARCCPFVQQLPDGLFTRVGEGGASLSGGQRQALSIVRALLKEPAVLVIDEGSAHLDKNARTTLLAVLSEQTAVKACILISHDEAVIEVANRVLQVEGGVIRELEGAKP